MQDVEDSHIKTFPENYWESSDDGVLPTNEKMIVKQKIS
jgi:hypothetical protein